jgi:cell wall-associated NlpC family hydrolase
MTAYFSTPERIARLEAVTASWLGTRYVQSGAIKGHGASCHRLAGAVLAEAGMPLPEIPERGVTHLREYREAMRTWLDGHPEHFAPVALEALQPGDVLLCDAGVGHIGLYLGDPGARALQVLRNAPAHIVSLNDPAMRRRVLAAYRPLESEA